MGDAETVVKIVGFFFVLYLLNIVIGGDVQSAEQSVAAITTLASGIGSLGEGALTIILFIGFFGYVVYQNNS